MTEHPHRHDVWGDDPEEADASAVVEELLADPGTARRWHDHPSIVWIKAVGRFIGRNGKRVGITIAGFAVILAGIALLVLPGPGWLLIFAGLAILSTEYVWAPPAPGEGEDQGGTGQGRRAAEEGRQGGEEGRTRGHLGTASERRRGVSPGSILIGTSSWTDPDAGQGRELLPTRGEVGGSPPEVLRVALPVGGGRFHLLLPAQREELRAVDRAHARPTSPSTSRRTPC